MEWVAIDVGIAGDPAVHRMAETLRVRVPEVVGLLALAFGGMTKHAPDGSVGGVPDSVLEMWATWHGKRGAFAVSFRAELCDSEGLVRAWERWNGRMIRRSNTASERSRAWRENADKERTERKENANRTHTQTHTVCRTGQDRTVQDLEAITNTPPARAIVISPAEEQLQAQAGEHYPPIALFLGERPADKRAAWARDLLKLMGPSTGVLPVDLARACTDGHLAEPPVTNARTLRIFVASCRKERWDAEGSRSGVAHSVGGDAISTASTLWPRYKAAGLVSGCSSEELREIGDRLVAEGHYADYDTFFAEIRITKPWDQLREARTDGWAVGEIAKRLAAAAKAAS